MIPKTIKIHAPATIAIMDVSPMVPPVLPITMENTSGVIPDFNCARGVAPV